MVFAELLFNKVLRNSFFWATRRDAPKKIFFTIAVSLIQAIFYGKEGTISVTGIIDDIASLAGISLKKIPVLSLWKMHQKWNVFTTPSRCKPEMLMWIHIASNVANFIKLDYENIEVSPYSL